MAVHKHPIAHHWIRQTLVPFLLFAFASTLPYPTEISDEIQRSIDFCLQKPDHPSDSDDLIFERIFMAIMHRHHDLASDLELVVDNLEPLAKYLIRRAQVKGPFELLGRVDIGSAAWVEHERYRLEKSAIAPDEARDELVALTGPPASKPLPAENDIDPRLVHAKQGHFTDADLPMKLTADEDKHYRRQNRELDEHLARNQQQQTSTHTWKLYTHSPPCVSAGKFHANSGFLYESPYQQDARASLISNQHARQQAAPLHNQRLPQKQFSQLQSTSVSPLSGGPRGVMMQPRSSTPNSAEAGGHQSIHRPLLPPPRAQRQAFQFAVPAHQHPQVRLQPSPPPAPQMTTLRPKSPATSTQHLGISVYTPAQSQSTISSSDFGHLRGTDWSTAAATRAREVAAEITAQERDALAQSIMRRQQAIAQHPPTPRAKRKSSTSTQPSLMPMRVMNSAVGVKAGTTHTATLDAVSTRPASMHSAAYTHESTSGAERWGMALPATATVSQQSHARKSAPAMSAPGSQRYSTFDNQDLKASQEMHGSNEYVPALSEQMDALSQLRYAALEREWLGGAVVMDEGDGEE